MIKGINTGGRYLEVAGGTPGSTYVSNYSGQPGVGNMRYNPGSNNIEIYDGNSWQQLVTSYATVNLTQEAQSLLDWARDKRNEDFRLKALADSHPAVAEAVEKLHRVENELKVIVALTEKHNKEPA